MIRNFVNFTIMKIFIIDGNNLIGKDKKLMRIQKKDKQLSREKLAFLLDNHYQTSRNKVFLHFDGFKNIPINTSKIKIIYSDKKTADDLIRRQIENSDNPKNITLVSSDNSLIEFAKVCRCNILKSEDYIQQLKKTGKDEEKNKIDSMNNVEEFKKIFGVK